MFGIGIFEILIIAVVCLIALGPSQLPVVMRKAASFYRQFHQLKEELTSNIISADQDVKSGSEDVDVEPSKPHPDQAV